MKTDQVAAWLGSFMDIELMLIDDAAVALTTINTTPAACTVGFSQVDTGLVIDGDGATDVRCEIVTVGGVVDKQWRRALRGCLVHLPRRGKARAGGGFV